MSIIASQGALAPSSARGSDGRCKSHAAKPSSGEPKNVLLRYGETQPRKVAPFVLADAEWFLFLIAHWAGARMHTGVAPFFFTNGSGGKRICRTPCCKVLLVAVHVHTWPTNV